MIDFGIVDTHFHIWDTKKINYPWLKDVPLINRSFLIEDYQKTIQEIPVEKMVFVQCECEPYQYKEEINFVLEAALHDARIQGMVVYFPLEKEEGEEGLEELANNHLIKGIRRLEENKSLYGDYKFISNLKKIAAYNFTFDLCVKAFQLPAAIALVSRCPEVSFMLDHLGKPDIKNREVEDWKKCIDRLAILPNVICKISGLVTEADWQSWKPEDLSYYFNYAVDKFGFDRLVFGGDWPVVTLAASYQQWFENLMLMLDPYSSEEKKKLLHDNAIKFYRL